MTLLRSMFLSTTNITLGSRTSASRRSWTILQVQRPTFKVAAAKAQLGQWLGEHSLCHSLKLCQTQVYGTRAVSRFEECQDGEY
jgi:hypothetical protein